MTHKPSTPMSRAEVEDIADRAVEDGEHAVVAACQVLLRGASDDERREALREVKAYVREIRGW